MDRSRLSITLLIACALSAHAETPELREYPADPQLNYRSNIGKPPQSFPDPEPWPSLEDYREGKAAAPSHIWVAGYAHPKQLCTWRRITERSDGTLRTRMLYYYRVGRFPNGEGAFELDLRNGGYLALRIDESIDDPDAQWIDGSPPTSPARRSGLQTSRKRGSVRKEGNPSS